MNRRKFLQKGLEGIVLSDVIVFSHNNEIYANSLENRILWKTQTGTITVSSPAIDDNGVNYIGSYDGQFHAINKDGNTLWSLPVSGWVYDSPVIGKDGIIYFGTRGGIVYAVNPNGTLNWEFPIG